MSFPHVMRTEDATPPPPLIPALMNRREATRDSKSLALLALSHTTVEHDLYLLMLGNPFDRRRTHGAYTIQQLAAERAYSYSTVRRAITSLIAKMSVQQQKFRDANAPHRSVLYTALAPEEVFTRRRASGVPPYPRELNSARTNSVLHFAAQRIVHYSDLTRREAQIALCCIEGLTNSEIGEKLFVSEHTVKSHLRNVFTKLGVKRRAELVSRLLVREAS